MTTTTDGNVRINSAAPLPPSISNPAVVAFCHPYYDWPDKLFTLPKLDSTSSTTSLASKGVHHGTALLACQIIANNTFSGYLAIDREGLQRVDSDKGRDELLTGDRYWFIADGSNPGDDYPVVPRFEDWRFPIQTFADAQWRCSEVPGRQPTPPNAKSMPAPPSSSHNPPLHRLEHSLRASLCTYHIQSPSVLVQQQLYGYVRQRNIKNRKSTEPS